jgi:hypothetical protein
MTIYVFACLFGAFSALWITWGLKLIDEGR